MPEFEFNFNDLNVNPEPSVEPEEEFPNIDHLVPEPTPEPLPKPTPVVNTPEGILEKIKELDSGQTLCVEVHTHVYNKTYRLLRKEKLQDGLSYKDGHLHYIKK